MSERLEAAVSEGPQAAVSERREAAAPEGGDAALPVERYAEAAAHLVHYRKADPAEVIERLGLDDRQYSAAREAWTAAMGDELSRQEVALSLRFGEVFAAVKERLAAEKPPLEAIGPRRPRQPLPDATPQAGHGPAATPRSERPPPLRGPGAEHAVAPPGDGGLSPFAPAAHTEEHSPYADDTISAEAPAPPSAPGHVQTPTFMAHDAAASPAPGTPVATPPAAPAQSPVNPAFVPVATPVVIVPAGAAPPEGGGHAEDIVPPGMRHFTGLDSTTPVFELPKSMPLPFARAPSSGGSTASSSPPATPAPPRTPAPAVPEGMRGFTSLTGTQGPKVAPKHPTMPFAKEPPAGPGHAASPPTTPAPGGASLRDGSAGGAPPAAAAPGGAPSPPAAAPGGAPSPPAAAPGGAPPPAGPLPIERYARLHVELAHEPKNRREVLRRHGIDEQRLAQLDAYWGPRIRAEPALHAAWDAAYAAHRARLSRPPGR